MMDVAVIKSELPPLKNIQVKKAKHSKFNLELLALRSLLKREIEKHYFKLGLSLFHICNTPTLEKTHS